MNRLRFPALLLIALLTAGITACGDTDTTEHEDHHHDHGHDDHDHHDDHGHETTFELMLFDPSNDEVLADVHGDHWHSDIPALYVGDELEVGVSIADANGNAVALGGEYTLQASVAEGSSQGVVAVAVHGDHIDITALAAGDTAIVLELLHDGTVEFSSPELALSVSE
ncbi:hypothetical protein DV096_04675 [Bradymonadaceae bacterium TMQ3]|nr:hypothetical protein DV096_04675 [Bradymonadaceae bacterium TMQ3]TXC77393.1 hypothetical protein FRC91_01260 [Bradymonadales bacterium TMQ1]